MYSVVKYFDTYKVGTIGIFKTKEEAKNIKNEQEDIFENHPYTSFEIKEVIDNKND